MYGEECVRSLTEMSDSLSALSAGVLARGPHGEGAASVCVCERERVYKVQTLFSACFKVAFCFRCVMGTRPQGQTGGPVLEKTQHYYSPNLTFIQRPNPIVYYSVVSASDVTPTDRWLNV